MIGADGIDDPAMGLTALDEELFGGMPDNGNDVCHGEMLHSHDSPTKGPDRSLDSHFGVTTSRNSKVFVQTTSQIAATSRSGHCTPPLSLPTTPMSPSRNRQHMASAEPISDAFLPSATRTNSDEPTQIVVENVSWVKSRITDVHQLLLHYLNLRDAHQSMATDLQKEVVLRAETKVALESIREQQDQTSEDFPKLQFQIAQLKLDCQKERAARAAAGEEIKAYASAYALMQTRVFDFETSKKNWQKEREELISLLESLEGGVGSTQPRRLPLEQNFPFGTFLGTEILSPQMQAALESDALLEKDQEIDRLTQKVNELVELLGRKGSGGNVVGQNLS